MVLHRPLGRAHNIGAGCSQVQPCLVGRLKQLGIWIFGIGVFIGAMGALDRVGGVMAEKKMTNEFHVTPDAYPPELVPFHKAKLEAETVQLQAETRKAIAEATKLEWEASVASRMATGARIAEEREIDKRDREKLSDDELRVYRFSTPVRQDSVDRAIQTFALWDRLDVETGHGDREYRLILNSPGGDILSGFGLYDFLRVLSNKGHRIVTETHSLCASMATLIFQAGDLRLIGPETTFLIHTASFGAMGNMGEVEDVVEMVKRMQTRIFEILAVRSTMTAKAIAKAADRKDWTMMGPEVVRLGFADALLPGSWVA